MPRPKKPKGQKRDETIQVKATRQQKRILEDKAAKANQPLSTWMLNVALNAAEPNASQR